MSRICYIKDEAKMFKEIRDYAKEISPDAEDFDIYMTTKTFLKPDIYNEKRTIYIIKKLYIDSIWNGGNDRHNLAELELRFSDYFSRYERKVGYIDKKIGFDYDGEVDFSVMDKFRDIVRNHLAYRTVKK